MFEIGFLPYWSFALTAGLAVYAVIAWPGKQLAKPIKEEVALWLMSGSNRQWVAEFNRLFDWVMGPSQFSIRRIVSSAIATVVAVGLLFLLMENVLGWMTNRTDAQITLWEIIVFALVINVVADYLSLIETRWLLGRFAHWQNWFAQAALLLFDLVISAIIIFASISLFRLIRGDDFLAPLEIIAGYTPFAIFFYSTFLTSIWAWAFCASAWMIRLFAGLRLYKVLDVEEKPFSSVGLIGAILVTVTLLVAKPMVEEIMPENVDSWLCLQFEGKICTHAARLNGDNAEKIEQLKLACMTGDAGQCRSVLDGFSEQMVAEAVPFLEAACWQNDDGLACGTFGFMYFQGAEIERDYEAAKLYLERSCRFSISIACDFLGHLYRKGLGVSQDLEKAFTLIQQGCNRGDMIVCTTLGDMYSAGQGVAQDFIKAHDLYEPACEDGNLTACFALAVMYYQGQGVPEDLNLSREFFKKACDGGVQEACPGVILVDVTMGK